MPLDDIRKKVSGESFFRTSVIESDAIERGDDGEETRRVRIAISSEAPVDRWFGREILVHDRKSVDLEFLNSGTAPLLDQHDHGRQIGVIESVTLGKDRILRALVRFSKSAMASEVYDDIKDGIRSNVSVGYRIRDYEKETDKDGEIIGLRITDWYPYEASIVSVPADTKVGVGRSDDGQTQIKTERNKSMPDDVIDKEAIAREAADKARKKAEADASKRVADVEAAAAARANEVAEIMELAARHNMTKEARDHIGQNGTIGSFRGLVLDKVGDHAAISPSLEVGLTEREIENFSIMSLIRGSVRGASQSDREACAFEREAIEAAAETATRNGHKDPQGLLLPAEVMQSFITERMMDAMGIRTLLAGTDTQLVPTEHRAASYIDILRNASSVMSAGARMLSDLSGNVDIPRMATSAGAAWISAEHGDSADGEPTWETVSLTPKDVSRSVPISRRMRQQASPAVEGLVRLDLAQSVALAIDLGALEGSGAAGQPTGVLNQTGVNKPTQFSGVNPTFAEVVAMETAVADDNALMGNLAYIGRTNMYGALKTTEKASGTAQFVVEPGGTVNGYRYIRSNQGTDGNLYFGNWADVLIGMWSGLDLVMDEATLAPKGGLVMRAFQTVDVAVRHPESFCYNNDAP